MHFEQMEYQRPDLDAITAQIDALIYRLDEAEHYQAAKCVFLESEKLFRQIDTLSELVNIRHCINTRDMFYNEETAFWSKASPVIGDKRQCWENALIHSKFRKEFAAEYGELMFQNIILSRGTFSEAILDDLITENNLMRKYESLQAGARVEFQGKTFTLSEMQVYKSSPDDAVRLAAWKAEGAWYHAHHGEIDEIFDGLVHARDSMGKKLGFDSYLPLGYKVRGRNCYDRADVERYRNIVAKHIVPMAEDIYRRRAARIGVPYPVSFADSLLEYRDGNAQPIQDTNGILETTAKVFALLSADAGQFFQKMLNNGLMDVVSRENKATGGYCASFPAYEMPFIFSNFNGTQEDVKIITHEAGHAFEVYTNRKRTPYSMLWPTGEACEVNSIGMEFFAGQYAEQYFGKDAEKYRESHLAQIIIHIPYGVAIDHFQHIAYENPDLTAEQRHEVWKELLDLYMPWIRLDGQIPFYGNGMGWQAQRHPFVGPLYFIDYSLAETVALEFWSLIKKDPEDAWKRYMKYTEAGGSKTFLDLLYDAALSNPFDESHICRLCADIRCAL